jgi:hypothetical protein
MRYEREAKEWLSLFALGDPTLTFREGPWLEYEDKSGRRYCQPDGLLVWAGAKRATILEIKYQHTSDAWYQLKQLYLPVLRVAMPGYSFGLLEIVHWFDPATPWPEEQVSRIPSLAAISHGDHSVQAIIFNRRRERRILEARNSGSSGVDQEADPLWPAQGAK